MKKGSKLAALLLGLVLVIPACNLGNNSSKDASNDAGISESSTVQPAANYTVSISNKEQLQAEWFVGDQSRKVEIATEPKANVAQLIKDGAIQITSSNPEILSINGQMASPVAAGDATIKVKCGESEDTVALTLKAQQTPQEKYGIAHAGTAEDPLTNEDAIAVMESGKYNNEDFYVKGVISSFYNAPGSRTDGMVAYFLTPAQENGKKFEIYKCFKEGGVALTDDDIWVGGTATAHGPFTTYGEQYETSSAIFVSCEGDKPNPRQTLSKTFAEAYAIGAALADGADSYDYIKFQGYVTKKSGNNYFLTATKGEEIVEATSDAAHGERSYPTNAIELYNAGTVAELVAKLLQDAKVEVTMVIKNYHGTIENGLNLTNDDVTVVEAGHEWVIPTTKATVAQALEVINALADGKTTDATYEITGYITAVTTAWNSQYKNISFTMGDTADAAASAVITVFRAKAAEGTDGSTLKAGDKVKVVGNLQKYVKDGAMTPELTNGETTLVEAGADLPVDITDVNAEATVKTVAEIRAYQAADSTVLAKVTGVAEYKYGNAQYGNFHLADPATGEEITIYGGYSDATFTKTGKVYATKTKTTAVTADIVGKMVTVYGTVGAYNNVGQLVDALVVVGDACTANVAASVAVNDESMGSAALSATTAAYGSDITVNITPASGYQIAKVEVQRAATKEEVVAVEGVYKFKAQAKNAVTVTFEAVPSATLAKVAAYDFSSGNTATSEYKDADGLTALAARFASSAVAGEGLSNIVTAATAASKAYAGQSNYLAFGMKFGTSSANGTFTITLSKNVSKVVVEAAGWTATDSLKVNDADAQVPGVAYTEENAFKSLSFNITASNEITFTFAKRGYIKAIEFYADDEGGTDPQPEIAQPVGSFSGYAVSAADDSNIFVNIALADSQAFVEVGSLLKTTVGFTFDKTSGLLTIALGGSFGNLTATYDEENSKLTSVAVDGAAAAMLKNNGTLELVAAVKFWDCNGSTAELQAMFKRRYMSGSWQVDSSNADRFVSYENGICGSAMQRRGFTGGAVAVNLAADMDPVEVSNIGFWVYNPGSTDLSLRMWIYKGAGFTDNAELGSVTAVAGQWTYCRMGFTKAAIYNFQIADFNNSGAALVFDNIVLF